MKNKVTAKQMEKLKDCKSVEEIIALTKENNIEMSEAEATNIFAQLNPTNSILSDSELEHVAGGCGDDSNDNSCPNGGEHIWVDTGNEEKPVGAHLRNVEQQCKKCGNTQWIPRHHN